MATTTPRIVRHGSTAVIRMDNPPVNCLDRSLRRHLLSSLEQVEHDSSITSVVLIGQKNFSAGADLKEFDSGEGLAEPTLHLTIAGYLDRMSKPVVAAIDGAALGGGLELALACHYRVATATATLGLPETTLGFMPGAGGTQRLPRAVGLENALNLIVSGNTITGTEALGLGLVDELAGDDLLTAALGTAQRQAAAGSPRRLRDEQILEPLAEALLAYARLAVSKNPRAGAGAAYAIDALAAAAALPFDEGLAVEYRLFTELCSTPAAKASRYRFLAERSAGAIADKPSAGPQVRSVAVVGAGTMGRGIALSMLAANLPTTIVETSPERLADAVAAVQAELDRSVARGRFDHAGRDRRLDLLTAIVDLAGAADADLVVEAVFEDLEAKCDVFARLDAVMKEGAVLASNTSSLDLNRIAAATRRPEAVVGLHFFSPAHVMPLVEVIQGAATSPETLAGAVQLVKRLKKIPVIAQVGDGFIGNRIVDQYLLQAMRLLGDGATPERIDRALERWGMAMGPFRVLDLVGNDIPWQARKARSAGSSPGPEWRVADEICERGWFGQKTGLGWYRYDAKKRPETNPELAEVLQAHAATGQTVTDEDIVNRCVLALVNEAAAVLEDGVAARASDIDLVFIHGYGFPRDKGGPLFHADTLGLPTVVREMNRLAARTSDPFWTPHPRLVRHAEEHIPLTGKNAS